jgi:hypothetical protein
MPTFEEHYEETKSKLGNGWTVVHRWLDELQPALGPKHRDARHNLSGVIHCITEWGFEAGAAACLHIHRDEYSHVKEGELWVPKNEGNNH